MERPTPLAHVLWHQDCHKKDILEYENSLPKKERFPEDLDDYFICSGTNPDLVMIEFCNNLLDWSERIYKYFVTMGSFQRAITADEKVLYDEEDRCYMCKRAFKRATDKHADIDYFTSKYLGAACGKCFTNRRPDKHFIPLVFHNAKGYDMHFVLKVITHGCYGCEFDGIPMNGEKLMSMTIKKEKTEKTKDRKEYKVKTMCDIHIIDSLLFTLLGLGPLTEILKAQYPENLEEGFPVTFRTFAKEKYEDEYE